MTGQALPETSNSELARARALRYYYRHRDRVNEAQRVAYHQKKAAIQVPCCFCGNWRTRTLHNPPGPAELLRVWMERCWSCRYGERVKAPKRSSLRLPNRQMVSGEYRQG
jgi:hypothetical protein